MKSTIYAEADYELVADLLGGSLKFTVITSHGSHTWAIYGSPTKDIPEMVRAKLPANWRGFWIGYPVREGARSAVEKILAERDAQNSKAADERQAALEAAVPGITELRAAYEDFERYHEQFERMMDDENNDGARPPRAMKANPDEVAKKFPRAAAYLKMEAWNSSCDMSGKSAVGSRAMSRLFAGEDVAQVLADAENEWHEIALRAVMNQ